LNPPPKAVIQRHPTARWCATQWQLASLVARSAGIGCSERSLVNLCNTRCAESEQRVPARRKSIRHKRKFIGALARQTEIHLPAGMVTDQTFAVGADRYA